MRTLGEYIRSARGKTSLEKLAERVEKSTVWMREIEKGKAVPTLELLLQLYSELAPKDAQDPNLDLKIWLLTWLKTKVEQTPGIDKEAVLDAITQLYGHSKLTRKPKLLHAHLPTLEDFPEGFENLVVVCGDRREVPPKTKGDLFVDSFSSADLISLNTLFDRTGPLEIRSDKCFVLDDRDYLERKYGRKNLIVLGAPSVNLLARKINKYCVFRFSITKDARDFLNYMEHEIPEINDPDMRIIFWDMATKWKEPPDYEVIDITYYEAYEKKGFKIHKEQIVNLAEKVRELLKDHTAKEMKNFFRKPGFVDPAEARMQGYYTKPDNDFGVISLCPNPYSVDATHLCILVAGIHAPGTVMATRVLATDNFKGHPLGGIIEVKLDLETSWIRRISTANYDWQTKGTEGYTIESVLSNLHNPKAHTIFDKCEPGDIDILISFIKRFV